MPERLVIGVDMGGTKLLAGLMDRNLAVHRRLQRQLVGLDQAAVLNTVQEAVTELAASAARDVVGVGFGIPSQIDRRTGTALLSVNLDLRNVRLGAIMAERLGLPSFIDNDGNLLALAEHRAGAARGSNHVIALGLGTGIAGGIIIDGRLYRGSIGGGAELGHMVIQADGPPCQGNCPNHGCIESLASGTALAREARSMAEASPDSGLGRAAAAGREVTGPLVTELAHDGDIAATEVLAQVGTNLGVAVSSLVNIFNPEVVVVGGGVIAAGELLLGPARTEFQRRALPPLRDAARLVAAEFGAEAGMIGAGAMAIDELAERGEFL
jgi:glucokinase